MKEMNNKEVKVVKEVNVPFGVNEDGESIAVTLSAETNATVVIHGRSGSGKTTLLKYMMSGVNSVYGDGVQMCIIDANGTKDYKELIKDFSCYNYESLNPAVVTKDDLIRYIKDMIKYRMSCLNLFDVEDIEEWNAIRTEKFHPVVVFVDEYQRFFGAGLEKEFADMANLIASTGGMANVFLVMASQSDRGTKVALNDYVFNSAEVRICLRADDVTSIKTIGNKSAEGLAIYGEGYYVTERMEEPVKFFCNTGVAPSNIVAINKASLEEKLVYSDRINKLMKELFVDTATNKQ